MCDNFQKYKSYIKFEHVFDIMMFLVFRVEYGREVSFDDVRLNFYKRNITNYEDVYASYSIARNAYEDAQNRYGKLVSKIISLGQIHGVVFTAMSVWFASASQQEFPLLGKYAAAFNILSIFFMLYAIKVNREVAFEYSSFKVEKDFLTTDEQNEFHDVICRKNASCDFLGDIYRVSLKLLIVSLTLLLTQVLGISLADVVNVFFSFSDIVNNHPSWITFLFFFDNPLCDILANWMSVVILAYVVLKFSSQTFLLDWRKRGVRKSFISFLKILNNNVFLQWIKIKIIDYLLPIILMFAILFLVLTAPMVKP